MTVFKACLKILNRLKFMILMYFVIFFIISINMSITSSNEENTLSFQSSKVTIAVINNDKGEIGQYIYDYCKNIGNVKSIIETEEGISDGLFSRIVEYIIVIPENFTEDLLNEKDIKIDKYEVAGSYSGAFMDNKINGFITDIKNTIDYLKVDGDINDLPQKAIDHLENFKKYDTKVSFYEEESSYQNNIKYHYNFAAYCIMAISILGVSSLVSKFSKEDIKKRNQVSPVSSHKFGRAQLLSGIILSVVICGLYFFMGIILYGEGAYVGTGIVMAINMMLFSLVALSMGFLVSNLVKSPAGQSAAANVISLGFSFISGIFVGLEYLGNTVKIIGSFTPTYWYVTINEKLSLVKEMNIDVFKDISRPLGIEILFGIAFLAVGFAAAKRSK